MNLKAEHVNPFIMECLSIFKDVTGISLKVANKSLKKTALSTKNTVIMLGVTGDLRGNVAINIDREGAKKVASLMMGGIPVVNFDDIAKSAVSEFGNMIMGRVATSFSVQDIIIDITPPTILTGDNIELLFASVPIISIQFNYENIEIDFDISISEKTNI